jgi:hypothetical protein
MNYDVQFAIKGRVYTSYKPAILTPIRIEGDGWELQNNAPCVIYLPPFTRETFVIILLIRRDR